MTTRAGFVFVLVLQATTIALLLYVVFEQKNAAAHICIQPNPVESRAAVQSEDQYGLSDEDFARLKVLRETGEAVSEKEHSIAEFHISKPPIQVTATREVAKIPDELIRELKRYQTMSEQEKRQLEAELLKQMLGSKEMRELVETISEALHQVDALMDGSEVEQ